ncbi:S24/S26 family peptidase [uncultured Oscillibacter sp.]|uniref:S24/S26 family peptidase n=1 Tax=uncultured Oscillibacter sp. TaxID=876091 RepID=UPI0025E57867|nr:S24/S26 family peptidase [uncultured Oscillibacter sp.]
MEQRPRQVDARTYLPVLMELLDQGRQVTLTVTGGSMTPFLVHGRDAICFSRPQGPLRRGDMAFFRRADGSYIMHRICRVTAAGYFLVGDGQQAVEGPVAPERVFAVVTKVRRRGRWIGPEDFWWRFFAGPWLWLRPVRPALRRGWSLVRRVRGGERRGS